MQVREKLDAIAEQRIIILDGAMGSMIQNLGLGESDFRGTHFSSHPQPLWGCNDLLCITKPQSITAIHEAYLAAGADIIKTCSFNATAVSLGEYGLAKECLAYEVSKAAAHIARQAAEKFSTTEKPRFIAGSMGPTAKSAGIPADINHPAARAIYWDELEAAYYDNARGLLDGGADILLLETIFDTLNAKAALSAIGSLIEERKIDIPLMVSATVSGDSGRLLTGQSIEAFCAALEHCNPWAVGLNCSFGAEKLLPHIRGLAALVPCLVSAHPNAGLPNHSGGYDTPPEAMAACFEPYLQDGSLNIAGGCCGSTPAHIAAIAQKAALYKPRKRQPEKTSAMPVTNVEGITITGNTEEGFEDLMDAACDFIDGGAAILKISIDEALPDAPKTIAAFLDFALFNPPIAKTPIMIDSSNREIITAALKHLPGKCLVNIKNLKGGDAAALARRCAYCGAVCVEI